jgi:gentisate 1,2-dioxygenase
VKRVRLSPHPSALVPTSVIPRYHENQSDVVTDTIVYATKGHGAIVSSNGKKRQELAPGDFALIPAYAEHQEVNDGEEEVVWIITRGGRNPVVQNLEGWGKS